jgi:hydroxymethylglutaryl-CoA reductase (NADPH)
MDRLVRVPYDFKRNYEEDFIRERRQWLMQTAQISLSHINKYSILPEDVKGNIENFIGTTQVPIGLMGPLKVCGEFAKGVFYVPMATTEGALVETYQRGAVALTKSGGVRTKILRDGNYLDPVFIVRDLKSAEKLVHWVTKNFDRLKKLVKQVTKHGELKSIEPFIVGRRVILKFFYHTQDAMGANIINMATEKICQYITKHIPTEKYLLRSNLSSEKKASGMNLVANYGKEVLVEAVLPQQIVSRYLNASTEEIATAWHSWALGSFHAGMLGINAQFANGLAAMYIACGQDVAHIVNGSVGLNMLELTKEGDLYAALKLPNILVGTVGGGTALGTQRECLQILGCYGQGKSRKFAEIVGATLLAGELGICAGITTMEFLAPHVRANQYTREKAYADQR